MLFVVPTLDLAAQTALAWRRYGHTEHMVIVSSMDAAGRDALVSARVMSSSDPVTLAALMSVVGERGPDPGPDADLHLRLTRQDPGNPQHRLHRAAVRPGDHGRGTLHRRPPGQEVGRRPRQPAHPSRPPPLHDLHPPRIFAAPDLAESADTTRPRRRTPTGPAADLFANSMNNKQVYGKKIFEYPLAQAIEDGRAPDYRIVVPTLTDDDLRRRINLPAPDPDGEGEGPDQALRTTAPHLAVLRAMADHGLKKVLVYFNLT
ncbi:hypothetical protein [Streptomyces parvus]|uniref:hypothetical protein n=1 Tax=Streptomyces parvus TaxID=66428 RepID=UPI0033C72D9F